MGRVGKVAFWKLLLVWRCTSTDAVHPTRNNGEVSPHWRMEAVKTVGHANKRDGHTHARHLTNQRESDAVKQPGLSGPLWFDHGAASASSKSATRKAASAAIAEIPYDLSNWIARCLKP